MPVFKGRPRKRKLQKKNNMKNKKPKQSSPAFLSKVDMAKLDSKEQQIKLPKFKEQRSVRGLQTVTKKTAQQVMTFSPLNIESKILFIFIFNILLGYSTQ